MRRRALALALALLTASPLSPALAADPGASSPEPSPTNPVPADPPADPSPEPSLEPSPELVPEVAPTQEPQPQPTTSPADASSPAAVREAPWIVVLKPGADLGRANERARGLGIQPDRTFRHAVRGYAAELTADQVAALRRDPAVAVVVPDDLITIQGQTTPNGVRRVFGPKSPVARINGIDERVDADVAIVDTGIDPAHRDLNVVGGVNCSTADRSAWQDDNGHGTHVAGTVGALDNDGGVVGVAPGARLWAVRILDASGWGRLSWYVCGLDWITAMRDPSDASRPLFEAVNMSVAKSGSDDRNCGNTNADILHQAVCRLVSSGVTVVAAAGNNSSNASKVVPGSYNEVVTVSALADTDGKPGALGGNSCWSWGSYDRDETFADFSNFGADVDLIAPGKCIWSTRRDNSYGYSSGTSMATPHVTGAVALYKASRPLATPADVKRALQSLGNLDWKTGSDPDAYHERLLDVSGIGPLAGFSLRAGSASVGEAGGTVTIPVTVVREPYFIEEVALTAEAGSRLTATLSSTRLFGATATTTDLRVVVPKSMKAGTYEVVVRGTNWGRERTARATIVVGADLPVMSLPRLGPRAGQTFATTSFVARATWAATDATSPIAGYRAQWRVDGGSWEPVISLGASTRYTTRTFLVGHAYGLRVRAVDTAGNWSAWSEPAPFTALVVQDGSSSLTRVGTWRRYDSSRMSGGTTRYARIRGASISRRFTGRGVSLVLPESPTRGRAQVWVDGVLVKTVDTYRSTSAPRRVMFSRTWSTSATHSIRLVVLGTSGRPRVDFDALVIIR